MAEAPANSNDTIEWGDQPAQRLGWLARLTNRAPADGQAPANDRPSYVAMGLAGAGFAAVLAAQYFPWVHLTFVEPISSNSTSTTEVELPLGGLNSWMIMAYGFEVVLVLAAVAFVLFGGRAGRRPATAAAAGLLAGHAATLVGLASSVKAAFGLLGPTQSSGLQDDAVTIELGFLAAVLVVPLLLAAVLVAVRPARSLSSGPAPEAEEDEPIDLVVTPLPGEIGLGSPGRLTLRD
jgi:hypothetical protein